MFKNVYLHRVCISIDEMIKDALVNANEYYNFLDKLNKPKEYVKLTDEIVD